MCTGSSSSSGGAVDRTSRTTIAGAGSVEQQLRDVFGVLNDQQAAVLTQRLQQIVDPNASASSLTPQDREAFSQAYDPAMAEQQAQARALSRFASGGRGSAISDNAIGTQGMRGANLGMSQLVGQRASGDLGFGLNANAYRTNAAIGLGGAVPRAGAFSLQNYLTGRIAQPTITRQGTGMNQETQTPSGLQMAAGIAQGFGGMMSGIGKAYQAYDDYQAESLGTNAFV